MLRLPPDFFGVEVGEFVAEEVTEARRGLPCARVNVSARSSSSRVGLERRREEEGDEEGEVAFPDMQLPCPSLEAGQKARSAARDLCVSHERT